MSAQPVTTLDTIEHLDFKPELPCEHPAHPVEPWHSGPGKYLIRRFAHCPNGPSLMLVCSGVWNHAADHGLRCGACGFVRSRDEGWQLLEVLS